MKITKTKVTKTGWHLLLVSAATAEFAMSRTILRKLYAVPVPDGM